MSAPTRRAFGATDVGRVRDHNEDRFHVDPALGVYIVVDGVGGHAAGEVAAETALGAIVERLTRQTGALTDRVREAIIIANNAVHRAAQTRADWRGMTCVLTLAVVDGARAVVGHVGDSRLYRVRGATIEKITPDHSPVGEREDAREISEAEAMRHPRRNEVYRDVGSEPRDTSDATFAFVAEIDLPSDAALLICSDGLTDLVTSDEIRRTIAAHAGHPDEVVTELLAAANQAGGKDNVTVIYVEGADAAQPIRGVPVQPLPARGPRGWVAAALVMAGVVAALGGVYWYQGGSWPTRAGTGLVATSGPAVIVREGESIMAAVNLAEAGTSVIVEPGEYRERLTLKDHVRVISRVPRGATLRLPADAGERDALVIAVGVTNVELAGFRLVGDSASPLGTAVVLRQAGARLIDLEISGAVLSALDLGPADDVSVLGCDVHDNPGAAVTVRTGAAPRLVHNVFARNATGGRAMPPIVIEAEAAPHWSGNVFHAMEPQMIPGLVEAERASILRDNVFVMPRPAATPTPAPSRRGRGVR